MTQGRIKLSAFADEISPDLHLQLDTLAAEGIRHLELRGVWGKGVLDLTDAEAAMVKREIDARGMAVSALGSPIGKISITAPFPPHLEQFKRALERAVVFGTRYVRIFSFFMPAGEDPSRYRDEVLGRLRLFLETARGTGLTLLHENEKHIYGDTGERCREILAALAGEGLRAVFDPANYVQCGVRPMAEAFPLVEPHVEYVHIKDALLADGSVTPAGRGDGEVGALLAALQRRGYAGFLSLEPHLLAAGTFSGFTGPDLFRAAAGALRGILDELAWEWE